ncbi:hypothetical protein DVA67_004320 [Solirubrobacter sp. CPCC 204708]|uniref:Uncharacterized protein n=1 Tax=Solirubrobacter deserti TaxID=2282478 RepID=A0ABT4RH39_9ACTN|nr:hypothetical protein [Solirubrobacter deserti]MBE2315186.1 hypothetical protein [Solirubrobacter deserti]MDA0137869.1 hypothetical protein [Solirubrobacter deserti]
MTERPRPDMDKVRDAMREHDEREDTAPEPEPEEAGTDEPDDDGDT